MLWILETERLKLRVWTLDDLDAGVRIWGDPEVMKYVDPEGAESREEIADSIKHGIKHQGKYGVQHWAVIEKESGNLVGCCGFNLHDDRKSFEMVFHFSKNAWGRGYATESGTAAIDYAKKLKLSKIEASVHPENRSSARVLEKLGFTQNGEVFMDDFNHNEPFYELVIS